MLSKIMCTRPPIRSTCAGAAGTILDDELLPGDLAHLGAPQAGEDVGAAARRENADEADGGVWPDGLAEGWCRERKPGTREQCSA
jgi:hypothetical protein